jgi:nucleoside-diphosphate-sugar epimerase
MQLCSYAVSCAVVQFGLPLKQKIMILITGASGLLGSHLLYILASQGMQVRATKRPTSDLEEVRKIFTCYNADPDEIFSKVEWVDADLMYPESLEPVFDKVEKVYHCAAYVSFDPRDRKSLINNNRIVTANIVNACLGYENIRLLHVSSTSALGASPNGEPVTEKMMWTPDKMNTGYSISKFLSEMEVWRGIEEGLNAVIVNPSIILGPGFWHKGSSSMFSNINKGLKYYMNGITGFVGVEDVVKAMVQLMESDIVNERFLLTSENLSYREVFSMIAEELNVDPPMIEATPFLANLAWRLDAFRSFFGMKRVITRETVHAGNNVSRFSNEKIKERLGIEFESVRDVIRKTAGKYPIEGNRD